jgi:hypothetical protein
VVTQPVPLIDLEQVIGETLAEHVGTVARNAVAGCIYRHPPFASQRKVDDDSARKLVRHAWDVRRRCEPEIFRLAKPRPLLRGLDFGPDRAAGAPYLRAGPQMWPRSGGRGRVSPHKATDVAGYRRPGPQKRTCTFPPSAMHTLLRVQTVSKACTPRHNGGRLRLHVHS